MNGANGFDIYVKEGLVKAEKESAFETWYKANSDDVEEEYQEYIKETERLGDKPMDKKKWAKEIFESQTVEEELDVPTRHQLNVALKTIKMHPAMLGAIGGMTYKDAIEFFRKIKYSEAKIKKLLSDAGHSEEEIKKLTECVNPAVKTESLTLSKYISSVLSEAKKTEIKGYPELKAVAKEVAKKVGEEINSAVMDIESEMPYKAKYVLEEVIKILQAHV